MNEKKVNNNTKVFFKNQKYKETENYYKSWITVN